MDAEPIIRKINKMDCKAMMSLIEVQYMEYKLNGLSCPKARITENDFVKDGFVTSELSPSAFGCFVAYVKDNLVGFAIFYYVYSMWHGRDMSLEDIFIHPGFRGRKVGTKLLKRVAEEALTNKCSKMDFALTLSNNNGFFLKRGAIMTTDSPEANFRFTHAFKTESLKRLVQEKF